MFVDLLNHNEYEILNEYPFTIRKKSNHYIIKEGSYRNGYICVCLNCVIYYKHRLIAEQFLENPNNYTDIDHINHDRTDFHLSNLRWTSHTNNLKNRKSRFGHVYEYVDKLPENAIIVDYYDTKNGRHEFRNYYYHDGVFYYDNDVNYRILIFHEKKKGNRFVKMIDNNGKDCSVYFNQFLQQHELI